MRCINLRFTYLHTFTYLHDFHLPVSYCSWNDVAEWYIQLGSEDAGPPSCSIFLRLRGNAAHWRDNFRQDRRQTAVIARLALDIDFDAAVSDHRRLRRLHSFLYRSPT